MNRIIMNYHLTKIMRLPIFQDKNTTICTFA